ncbi:hypothetical protein C8Q76DRAFT_623967, partial [Earliella scabrosa]
RRNYTKHQLLFRLLEPVNMSGDEREGPKTAFPHIYRIIVSSWQSQELRNFLWALDTMYRQDFGTRGLGGNPPRQRVLREGTEEEDGVAPIGLWRNCYNPAWLKKQPPHIIRELEIVDEDYDFSL